MLYQAALAGWHDFFILAGTASATLVGLLFVGLSLHFRIVAAPSLVGAVRSGEWSFEMSTMQRVRVVLRFGLSGLSYLAIIVAGILLPASSSAAFGVLVTTIVVLLVVSLRNTWDLLVTVADVTE
jgi:hypothetical protein